MNQNKKMTEHTELALKALERAQAKVDGKMVLEVPPSPEINFEGTSKTSFE